VKKNVAENRPTILPLPEGIRAAELVRRVDPWIAGATVFLLSLGTVLVYSATAVRAQQSGDAEAFLMKHAGSVLIGLILMGIAIRTPVERWSRIAYPLLGITVLLLVLLFVPGVGKQPDPDVRGINGALRWLSFGGIGFQPGELAKLAVVIYLAHSLAKKRDRASSFSIGFLPHVMVTSLVVALILIQPDIGTSAVIYATLGVMLFAGGTKIGYLVLAVVAALPVAYHYVATRPHAWARMLVFLNPEAYKKDIGYQVWESLVAFGSGGAFGLGLGAGQQKLYFLPESHTDFIFSVLGQELGFLGAAAAIAAFAIIVARGSWIASNVTCRFPMFLAFGITAWLGVQALTNMAVAVALLPTKGLTLPLVSYGRSSLIVTMLAVGILLRVTAEHRLNAEGREE
jgi:cell division protein FtsW